MMKRVSFLNIIVTIIVVTLVIVSSVVPAYAVANPIIEAVLSELINMCITPDQANVGEDEIVDAMNYARKVWRSSLDMRTEVDYDVLASVYAQLIVQGVPCKMEFSRGAAQGYYIRGTGELPLCNGKARISIKGAYFSDTAGNIFYANRSSSSTSTTIPSGNAPTVTPDTSTPSGPAVPVDPSTPGNQTSELNALNQVIKWLADIDKSLLLNARIGVDITTRVGQVKQNVIKLVYGVNDLLNIVYHHYLDVGSYLYRLDDIADRLVDLRDNSWASLDAQNRIYSAVVSIGNQLGSVIRNGQLQVNTSPLEARLDKLISMYSKVNSVVLDTASVTGGQITGAVGGELKDVVFWGDTGTSSNEFLTPGSLWYRLGPNVGNTTPTTLDDSIVLRSVNLGSTIPSYIANDPVLYAGVWRKGTDYIISDTYNASTGEYVQRVSLSSVSTVSIILDAYGRFVLSIPNSPVVCSEVNFSRSSFSPNASIYSATGDLVYMIIDNLLYCIDRSCTSVPGFVSKYSDLSFLYPRRSAVVQNFSPASVFIPEGNSYILSYCVRITGKYETYDSYTQTADIITAINNIPPVDLDLTPLSSRLDTLNTTISSVISQGKLKVDNSAVVTALGKLDKLDDLPTIKAAVDGVNTTIASVISEGRLKVDNSAVVAAIEGIQAGSAADLSPVVVRMDAILAELQSAPGSAACEHTYTQHTEQEATCTLPGLLIFTCSQCGDSYSEIVNPLGHDWIVTSHVDAVTDPETGEETASAYDVYTCSRCQRTYEDHDGSGPEEDYSSSSISKLVVKVFSRLGTFAGKLIGSVIHLFDKAITALDNVVSKFNEYVEQISGFGGGYPAWLTGFWGVLPAELQVALTFAVICMALGVVGKKLFFS